MENNFYVYMYLREDGTPYYVGKGRGYRAYEKGQRISPPPKEKSRIVFSKQNLTEEEAFQHEIDLITLYGRKDLGTGILRNLTNGGEGTSGAIHSEEVKRKMSEVRKGKPSPFKGKTRSEEFKRKISEVTKGEKHPFFGKTHSEESRKKMSESLKGKPSPFKGKTLSLERRRKISEGQKGRTVSEETKRKIGEANKARAAERKKLKLEEISKSS